MRMTFLASLAVMLLACQPPGAPNPDGTFTADSVVVEQSDEVDPTPTVSEDHAGC
jgi:hypothetical protein